MKRKQAWKVMGAVLAGALVLSDLPVSYASAGTQTVQSSETGEEGKQETAVVYVDTKNGSDKADGASEKKAVLTVKQAVKLLDALTAKMESKDGEDGPALKKYLVFVNLNEDELEEYRKEQQKTDAAGKIRNTILPDGVEAVTKSGYLAATEGKEDVKETHELVNGAVPVPDQAEDHVQTPAADAESSEKSDTEDHPVISDESDGKAEPTPGAENPADPGAAPEKEPEKEQQPDGAAHDGNQADNGTADEEETRPSEENGNTQDADTVKKPENEEKPEKEEMINGSGDQKENDPPANPEKDKTPETADEAETAGKKDSADVAEKAEQAGNSGKKEEPDSDAKEKDPENIGPSVEPVKDEESFLNQDDGIREPQSMTFTQVWQDLTVSQVLGSPDGGIMTSSGEEEMPETDDGSEVTDAEAELIALAGKNAMLSADEMTANAKETAGQAALVKAAGTMIVGPDNYKGNTSDDKKNDSDKNSGAGSTGSSNGGNANSGNSGTGNTNTGKGNHGSSSGNTNKGNTGSQGSTTKTPQSTTKTKTSIKSVPVQTGDTTVVLPLVLSSVLSSGVLMLLFYLRMQAKRAEAALVWRKFKQEHPLNGGEKE